MWSLDKATAVYSLVAERHDLTLAEVRNGVRLSAPVRHPRGRSGPAAKALFLTRGLNRPQVSVAEFAAWVLEATTEIAAQSNVS